MKHLIEEGVLDELPSIMESWWPLDGPESMYPPSWKDKGLFELEIKQCPWWLDYPLGQVPPSERALWEGIFLRISYK